jgi:predicted DNA-binding transcriptional regulator YafY
LLLEPDVAWVAESYPTESVVARAGDRLEIVLAVSGAAFLDRLLLALGERATVLDPAEARAQLVEAASRVLERYGRAS